MSIARRSFLKSATMSALSAGLALASGRLIFGQRGRNVETPPARQIGRLDVSGNFQIPFEAQEDALFSFRASTFKPYVGDILQAPNARGEMIELKLTRVSEYKVKASTRLSTRKARQSESFSLTFSASEQLPPFTSIHRISHPALGEFDLFLTRSETEDGTFMYEAVFNHIR
jgi:hypothetical protein